MNEIGSAVGSTIHDAQKCPEISCLSVIFKRVAPPFSCILQHRQCTPQHIPDNASCRAFHTHGHKHHKCPRKRCTITLRDFHPSTLAQQQICRRKRIHDPVRCNGPSFLYHPLSNIPQRSVRMLWRRLHKRQYRIEIFRGSYFRHLG